MKKFRCIPIALALPILFSLGAVFWIFPLIDLDSFVNAKGEPDPLGGLILCVFMILLASGVVLFTLQNAWWRVELLEDKVICKGLLPKDSFEMEYAKCNVGMDFHLQNGNKIWWIYMCYGPFSVYKSSNPSNRMNAIKICPGFIKIMYRDDVYNALLEALPKKQRTGLITARRCAGFEKQGRII